MIGETVAVLATARDRGSLGRPGLEGFHERAEAARAFEKDWWRREKKRYWEERRLRRRELEELHAQRKVRRKPCRKNAAGEATHEIRTTRVLCDCGRVLDMSATRLATCECGLAHRRIT